MGPYQQIPKEVIGAIRYSGFFRGPFSGSCWRSLGKIRLDLDLVAQSLEFFFGYIYIYNLQGTNISPKNGILKMIFLFPRWDMLIPWREDIYIYNY